MAFGKSLPTDPDDSRMTLGEHLEELRGCLARSLVALFAAALLCIWPSKYLLELIARPVILVLRAHGQPDSFLATSPVESFFVYIKVVVIFALILAGPYVIYQLWSFVAAGLYPRERNWVQRLVPVSVGLFLLGVLFMYAFVLVISLKFLIGFSSWLPLPDARPGVLERKLLNVPHIAQPTARPGDEGTPQVPLVNDDPNDAPPGTLWINVPDGKLKIRGVDGRTYSVQVLRDDQRAMVTTHFKIGEYLTFVLIMTIAFGVAFQTPLVVLFLVRTGIVPYETFRSYRKVIILIILFIAGILAPPDPFSMILLGGAMWLLFELGLYFGRRGEKPSERDESAAEGAE